MREIKFRGKRIDNGEWVFGDYSRYSKDKSIIMVDLLEQEDYWVWSSTVGQYTGLKDKNGKEIYEGDIVDLPQHNHSGRVFLNVNHGWVVEGICMSVKVHNYKNIEVIGNIYEDLNYRRGKMDKKDSWTKEIAEKYLKSEVPPVELGNKNKTGECGMCGVKIKKTHLSESR